MHIHKGSPVNIVVPIQCMTKVFTFYSYMYLVRKYNLRMNVCDLRKHLVKRISYLLMYGDGCIYGTFLKALMEGRYSVFTFYAYIN